MKGKLCPYGGEVIKRIKSGAHVNLWVFATPDAWERAQYRWKYFGEALCLPPGHQPSQYTWPVKGLEVVLICDRLRLTQSLGETLIKSGAVTVCAPFDDTCLFFKPSRIAA